MKEDPHREHRVLTTALMMSLVLFASLSFKICVILGARLKPASAL